MALAIDIVSWGLILAGSFFILIGALGIVRFPDFFTRLHAAGVTDSLGAELILFALILQSGWSLVSIKLFLVGAFIFFTSPTATHAIANAAFTAGMRSKFADGQVHTPEISSETGGEAANKQQPESPAVNKGDER